MNNKPWASPAVMLLLLLLAFSFRWSTLAIKTVENSVCHWTRDNWTGDLWLRIFSLDKTSREIYDYNTIKVFEKTMDNYYSKLSSKWWVKGGTWEEQQARGAKISYDIESKRIADAWMRRTAYIVFKYILC